MVCLDENGRGAGQSASRGRNGSCIRSTERNNHFNQTHLHSPQMDLLSVSSWPHWLPPHTHVLTAEVCTLPCFAFPPATRHVIPSLSIQALRCPRRCRSLSTADPSRRTACYSRMLKLLFNFMPIGSLHNTLGWITVELIPTSTEVGILDAGVQDEADFNCQRSCSKRLVSQHPDHVMGSSLTDWSVTIITQKYKANLRSLPGPPSF